LVVRIACGRLVAGGTGTNTIAYSSDGGTTWTGVGAGIACVDLDWNGHVAVAATGDGFARSYDGVSWAVDTSGVTTTGVRWIGGNRWISSGDVVRVSGDGLNWSTALAQASTSVSAMSRYGAVRAPITVFVGAGERMSVVGPDAYDGALAPDTNISLAMNLA
jgi:hypothetical protein